MVYSVKIVGLNGGVVIDNLELDKCTSVEALKTKLCEQFLEYTEGCDTQFGYISPGHGMKGKQEKVDTDEVLAAMYDKHKERKHIFLWLKCKRKTAKKRACPESASPPSKRQSAAHASLVNMMSEVDGIVDSLKQKHGEKSIHL